MSEWGTSHELVIRADLEDSEPSGLRPSGLLTYQLEVDEFTFQTGLRIRAEDGLVVDASLMELVEIIIQRELETAFTGSGDFERFRRW
jgi:hypothetical protein